MVGKKYCFCLILVLKPFEVEDRYSWEQPLNTDTSRPQLAVSGTSKPPSHVLCTRVGLENFDLNDNSGYLGAL